MKRSSDQIFKNKWPFSMWSVKVLIARTALIHASSFLVNLGREQGGEGGGGGLATNIKIMNMEIVQWSKYWI